MANSIIYGPVSSWRLGRSLGIDLLSTTRKTCSFNCVYCQLGETTDLVTEPREFISLEQLAKEVQQVKQIEADYATFSGMGEPTLASNLSEAIAMIKSALGLPVAVLTNSSLMFRKDIRQRLAHADVVVAKLDVPNEELFATVNRPSSNLHFDQTVDGLRRFRDEYRGKLALQMMFLEANKLYASEMATIAHDISPDEVQINTPLRPCSVKPLPPDDIADIRDVIESSISDGVTSKPDSSLPLETGFKNVVTVYEAPRHEVMPLDLTETLRRRPEL